MTANIFVDWNYDMDALNEDEGELIAAALAAGEEPENTDKAPEAEDGEQPAASDELVEYGSLPEEDPYG